MCLVPWYGGKSQHPWLLPLIPRDPLTYVEPFGGAANVLLQRPKPPAHRLEVYADVDCMIVNLLRVLQDASMFADLCDRMYWTLQSREQHAEAKRLFDAGAQGVDGAWAAVVVYTQSFSGRADGQWRVPMNPRRKAGGGTFRSTKVWLDDVKAIRDRLERVVIENRDWRYVIDRHDLPDTAVYADPPYLADTREALDQYRHELQRPEQHEALLTRLNACDAAVVLSGYHSELYDDLLTDWDVFERQTVTWARQGANSKRTEVVWRNARCMDMLDAEQGDLFGATGP